VFWTAAPELSLLPMKISAWDPALVLSKWLGVLHWLSSSWD